MKHIYLWVIKSRSRDRRTIWNEPCFGYFARRSSINNPRFVVPGWIELKIKLFASKEDAEQYYFSKTRAGHNTKPFVMRRKKIFLKGRSWDHNKNHNRFL